MKRLQFIWLLLLAQVAWAQVTQLPDRLVYRGADYSFDMVLARADSALASSAVLYFEPGGSALPVPQQPGLTRTGRTLSFAWSAAQTGAMRDGKFWLEIRAGPSVRFAAWVYASKTPTSTTPPGTLTVISPIVEYQAAPNDKPYSLSNISPSGHRIAHGKSTKLVTPIFFREYGTSYREDRLWSILIIDDNTVEVSGPPGETFSGYLTLKPILISNQ